MKLIVAVIQDKDAPRLVGQLVKSGFKATKLASTGGFIREGNTTLLMGVDESQVDAVLEVVRTNCRAREQVVTPVTAPTGAMEACVPYPVAVVVGGATVFVLDIDRFVQI